MEMKGKNEEEMKSLVWEEVSVITNHFHLKISKENGKKLVNRVSGYAFAGRIMAIMGPSGSGKSTLLDALAGRLAHNVIMTGNVLLNGKKTRTGCISYVTQDDYLLGTLTVKETLTYSAQLRLPSTMTNHEINAVVEKTISDMGLQECADRKIGNWHLRGISGGEKRRLSISLEMLTQPRVMFLDEPTSGLDSAAAFFVVQALKNIALDNKIVICSVHQPSSFIFDLFDDLCLLSSGQTIYFGEAKTAMKFFAEAGFPCPTRRNPADHFLRCINSDFDKISAIRVRAEKDSGGSESSEISLKTQEIKAILIEKYRESGYSIHTRKTIREITLVNDDQLITSDLNTNNDNWWKQLRVLTTRSLVNNSRDLAYYWIRILFCVLVAIGTGSVFYDIGLSYISILSRNKCYAFFYTFMLCLCVGGLPSIAEEWKVLYYERLNRHYGEGVFVVSNFLSSFPFLVVTAVLPASILYGMVKFHMGFWIFLHFCINIFCCISIMENLAMIIQLLLPNFLMGVGAASGIIILLLVPSGLPRPVSELTKFFWRYPMTYVCFSSWSVQAQYKNDMIGLEFDPLIPGDSKVRGEEVLETFFGVDLRWSKWWDLAALVFLLMIHRVCFLIILKYKDRVRMLLSRIQAKETIKSFAQKSSSFRREILHNSFTKRHQLSLHSLASQEGLSSPLP